LLTAILGKIGVDFLLGTKTASRVWRHSITLAPGVFINRLSAKEGTTSAELPLWYRLWARFVTPIVKGLQRLLHNRRVVRYGLVSCNVLLLVTIGFFILRGSAAQDVLSRSVVTTTSDTNPLDQLSSAEIAANVAQSVGLAETTSVQNNADSVDLEQGITQADSTAVAKPQTVNTSSKSKADIVDYTIQAGETVASIAAKFSVTSDSIMWSNGLRGNTVAAGTVVVVPPINGIVYTVRAGDTPDSLAQRYRANKDQIVAFNDVELTGLKIGERIVIPNGQQAAPTVFSRPIQAVYGYNGYDYGWCTWYAADRRAKLGRPVPANLGNANTWASRAAAAGIATGSTPQAGAVAMRHARAPGHVAVVEVVNSDGSFWISEMNSRGVVSMTDSRPYGGWGKINWKLIPASAVGTYTYIY
jgi:surface antigen